MFFSHLKNSSFLRHLNLGSNFFGHLEKRLYKKANVIFKIYDAINWETNDYNTHIAQYLKK